MALSLQSCLISFLLGICSGAELLATVGTAARDWQIRNRSLLGPGVPVQKPHGGAVLLFQAAALTLEAASGELDTWVMAKTQNRKYGNKSRSEV